ncbi:hypothetical protein CH263_24515 [Rhodococcus sp. 06-1059B-a]|nr:hypothetical protein CH263_24515 [Rhodococcus sp. 06-1059B-a]
MIVNYFSSEMISDLFASLDVLSFDGICVVDNSCDVDEVGRLISVCRNVSALTVRTASNVGFGAAVNLGASQFQMSSSDYLWILNPDTIPDAKCARSLLETMRLERADFGSPVIVTGSGRDSVWFSGGFFDIRRGRTEHFVDAVSEVRVCNFLTGAALMVSAQAWKDLSGFREDLFMYWEDADLSIRASKLGCKMIVDPGAEVWHAVGATSSTSGRSSLFHYYMQRNRLIVLREQFGAAYCWHPMRLLESLRMTVRALRESSGRRGKVRASIMGAAAGLQGR